MLKKAQKPYNQLDSREYEKRISLLTNKEYQIFTDLVVGFKKKEIAKKRKITFYTAQTHIKFIYKKLQVHSQVELMIKYGKEYKKIKEGE